MIVYLLLENAISSWLIHSRNEILLSLGSCFKSNFLMCRVPRNFIIWSAWEHTLSEVNFVFFLFFLFLKWLNFRFFLFDFLVNVFIFVSTESSSVSLYGWSFVDIEVLFDEELEVLSDEDEKDDEGDFVKMWFLCFYVFVNDGQFLIVLLIKNHYLYFLAWVRGCLWLSHLHHFAKRNHPVGHLLVIKKCYLDPLTILLFVILWL